MKSALVSLLLLSSYLTIGQSARLSEGKFPSRIFTPREYIAGNNVLCFVQDSSGILYAGNSRGISIFNGANWSLVELPNKSEVLWLSVNNRNQIFVAANEEFGVLKNENGISSYQSLTHLLPDSIQGFGSIWEVESTSYGTYFRTSSFLFWYHDDQLDVLPMNDFPGGRFDVIYSVNDTLYLRKRELGIGKMIGNEFKLLREGESLSSIKTNSIMQFEDKILIATRSNGLYVSNKDGISEFDNEIQQLLKDARIYHAATYKENIAIATLTNGVFIIDKKGNLIEHINEQKYNINETTNFVYFDKQDALWIGTLNGIMRVDFQDKFRVFDSIEGSNIVILDFVKHKDIFYFATSTGMYYSKTNDFKNAKRVNGINNPCYNISIIDDRIFIYANSGIFRINKQFHAIKQGEKLSGFVKETRVKDCYFLGGQEGLLLAMYDEKKFKVKKTLDVGKNITSLFEFKRNQLWIFPKNNGITYYNIDTDSTVNFSQFGNSKAVSINGNPTFITSKGPYEYTDGHFTKSPFFYQHVDSAQYSITDIQVDADGNILILYNDPSKITHGKWLEKVNDLYTVHAIPDIDISSVDYTAIYLDEDGVLWLAGNNKILRIDIPKTTTKSTSFQARINTIYAGSNRLIIVDKNQNIPFSDNTILFNYSAIYYNSYGNNKYQYLLEGIDDQWSEWSETNFTEFTYLREGNYTFKVRAKNPNDIISNEASFEFTILSPWYRSNIAMLLYVFLIVGVIIILSRIRSATLEKENRVLEKLVNERTKEVALKNEKLEELSQLKSKFFANISHELRTPLTLINGQLDGLHRSSSSSDTAQRIESSKRNVAQLGNMIEDLLDLSKLELNQKMINPHTANVKYEVGRMVKSFQSLAEAKKIKLLFEDQLTKKVYANLDTRQFEKVINNLIYNAFKFTRPNGEVGVTLSRDKEHIFIEIFDTGSGIDKEELPHIFDRFYQAANQVDSEVGSGLGLAISKEIIELHDAKISVTSQLEKGTKFTINLKIVHGDFEELNSEVQNDTISMDDFLKEKIFKKGVDKPSILLVEDTHEMRYYLKEILSANFNIHEAINGLEALQWLKNNKVDLIISDVMMPVMTGLELLDEIKKSMDLQHIPVILLTALSSKEDKMEGLRFGVDDYITKPFDQDELLVRAANLIHNLHSRITLAKEIPDEENKNEISISTEDEKIINIAKEYIESRISESSLSVSDVASSVAMSERQFYRKLGKITGMTPANFIMEIRLYHAHKLLVNGNMIKLSQVSSEIGINSPSYFSKLFYERFGKKASKYLNK
ncbi:MAG: response regulator [Ekhidna sp.]